MTSPAIISLKKIWLPSFLCTMSLRLARPARVVAASSVSVLVAELLHHVAGHRHIEFRSVVLVVQVGLTSCGGRYFGLVAKRTPRSI